MRKDCQFKVVITEENPEILAYIDLCRNQDRKIQVSSVLVYALSVYYETEQMPKVAAVSRERCFDVMDGRREVLGFRYKSFANRNQGFFKWMETAESSVIRSLTTDAIEIVETIEEEYCREASELKKLGIHRRLSERPAVPPSEPRNEYFAASRERFKSNEGRISETFRRLGLETGLFSGQTESVQPEPEKEKTEIRETNRRRQAEEEKKKEVDQLLERIEGWTASKFEEE